MLLPQRQSHDKGELPCEIDEAFVLNMATLLASTDEREKGVEKRETNEGGERVPCK